MALPGRPGLISHSENLVSVAANRSCVHYNPEARVLLIHSQLLPRSAAEPARSDNGREP
jgi:hypothetical protein